MSGTVVDTSAGNTVRVYSCGTWDEFVHKVRANRFVASRIFRGQRDEIWKLASVWERFLDRMRGFDPTRDVTKLFAEGAQGKIRDAYLGRFKDYVIGLPGIDSRALEENDWWAIGRHHGLTTPLLDWTKSPYVAAFFAFLDYADHLNPGFRTGTHVGGIRYGTDSVAVWELVVIDKLEAQDEFELFSSRIDSAHRQKAQQGIFTRLTHTVHLDVQAYLKFRGLGQYLARYEISGQAMAQALWDLHLMNINQVTMFPDMQGAASMANLWDRIYGLGLQSSRNI
jgi:hypothetical protein